MITETPREYVLDLEATPDRVPQVRRIVAAHLRHWQLDGLIQPVSLGVCELLTNVHLHARRGQALHPGTALDRPQLDRGRAGRQPAAAATALCQPAGHPRPWPADGVHAQRQLGYARHRGRQGRLVHDPRPGRDRQPAGAPEPPSRRLDGGPQPRRRGAVRAAARAHRGRPARGTRGQQAPDTTTVLRRPAAQDSTGSTVPCAGSSAAQGTRGARYCPAAPARRAAVSPGAARPRHGRRAASPTAR